MLNYIFSYQTVNVNKTRNNFTRKGRVYLVHVLLTVLTLRKLQLTKERLLDNTIVASGGRLNDY